MKWFIWFLAGLILASLFSCSVERRRQRKKEKWEKTGKLEGWIKEKTDSLQTSIHPDTAGANTAVDNFADTLQNVLSADCPDLQPETITKIKYITKKVFVPEYLTKAYKDTAVTKDGIRVKIRFDSAGKLIVDAAADKQIITLQEESKFWPGVGVGAGGVSLLFIIISFIIFTISKKMDK